MTNEEEFGANEPTPTTVQVKMSEATYVSIKIIVAKKQMYMRDFYAQAFEAFVKKRERFRKEGRDDEFIYRAGVKEGKLVSIGVFERHLEEIDRMAEEDNVHYRAAYYTAIIEHVERMKEEIKL